MDSVHRAGLTDQSKEHDMNGYRHLAEGERRHIARRLQAHVPIRQIALELGRAASTLYRELSRNAPVRGGYEPCGAQQRAAVRAARSRSHPKIAARTWVHAQRLLERMQFSPATIASHLGISAEWLYQWVYRRIATDQPGWAAHLRTQRSARRHRRLIRAAAQAQAAKRAPNIVQRPKAADTRSQFGHWEADLLLGRQSNRRALLVLKERTSRLTLLAGLRGRDAHSVRRAMQQRLKAYASHLHSLSTDNGSEFSQHAAFTAATGCPMFVCDPHSPWQRGQVEGENRNIRQYLPKGFDADRLTTKQVRNIERKLNLRPRKVLGGLPPLVVANRLSGVALRY